MERCIESILAQSYKNLEIILVDDGSTDNSAKICDQYHLKDDRIAVFHKTNGGLSDARNFGLNHASGNYISFIDSDDFIERDMLSEMYNLISEEDCQIAISNIIRVFDDDSVESFYEPTSGPMVLVGEDRFESLKQPSVCNKLFKGDLFEGINFPVGKYYEDTFVYHKLVSKAWKVGFTGKTGYWYYARRDSILGQNIYGVKYFDFVEAVFERMIFLEKECHKKYAAEARWSLYHAYANVVKRIKLSSETRSLIIEAKRQYGWAYYEMIRDPSIKIRQKAKIACLMYAPKIFRLLF